MKKISYSELAILLGFKKMHMLEKLACNHYIEEKEYSVNVISKMKVPVYVLLIVPICILNVFALAWDGGLKNFSIEPRTYRTMDVWKDTERYKKFLEKNA
jgi:hypothetical protein